MRVSLVSLLSATLPTIFLVFVLLLDRLGGFEAGVLVHGLDLYLYNLYTRRGGGEVQQYPKTMALM